MPVCLGVEGTISACHVTRNGERTYDIDYRDGSKLLQVREEYIQLFDEGKFTNGFS